MSEVNKQKSIDNFDEFLNYIRSQMKLDTDKDIISEISRFSELVQHLIQYRYKIIVSLKTLEIKKECTYKERYSHYKNDSKEILSSDAAIKTYINGDLKYTPFKKKCSILSERISSLDTMISNIRSLIYFGQEALRYKQYMAGLG